MCSASSSSWTETAFRLEKGSSFRRRIPPSRFDPIQRSRSFVSLKGSISGISALKTADRRIGYVVSGRRSAPVAAYGDDGVDVSPVDDVAEDFDDIAAVEDDAYDSCSDGEDNDMDIMIYPSGDIELPPQSSLIDDTDSYVSLPTSRLAELRSRAKTERAHPGFVMNSSLFIFLMMVLVFFDWCAWKIVRQPLRPFFLTQPFFTAAILATCIGFLCLPVLHYLKIRVLITKEGPNMHLSQKRVPTMGGLFFIPVGIIVAASSLGFPKAEVHGISVATLSCAAIGLVSDCICLVNNHQHGLPAWIKILLQIAVGTWFSSWIGSAEISTPYNMKMVVPLPQPIGLFPLGGLYSLLTILCFAAMSNGVSLVDRLDGLAGGVATLTFIGMSIASLPICSGIAVFGASMAGACIGFLLHNRYKISIFMGESGSLAVGGALAAMAAYSGMFFPLFISSGWFFMEALVFTWKVVRRRLRGHLLRPCRRAFSGGTRKHWFEPVGVEEPSIVAVAYLLSGILALSGGYVGLISA